MRHARLAGPRRSDEDTIEGRIRYYIDEFATFNFTLLLIFGLFLILTQAFEVGWIGGIIGIQVVIGLHLLLLFKNQWSFTTQADKRRNGYKILESILLVIFLFTIQLLISDSAATGPAIALTTLFLLNQFLKAAFTFQTNDKAKWTFDRYLNGFLLIFKLAAIFQVCLILAGSITSFGPWVLVFLPIYFIAGLLLVHFSYFLFLILSKTGRTMWRPLTIGKFVGLIWTLLTPILFAVAMVWCAFYIASVLDDNSSKYDIEGRPFLMLFIVMICVSVFALFYVYFFESAIILTSKYIACLMDLATPRYQARMEKLIKKLQDDYTHSLEDKFIPEILLKVSNVYYKLVAVSNGKTKISPMPSKVSVKDLENPEVGAQEQKEEEKPKETLADLDKHEEKVENNENGKCVICFDGNQDAVYLPCGHGGVCYECAQEMIKTKGDCHLCRKPIRRLMKVETEKKDNDLVKVLSVIKAVKSNTGI